ncbi:transglycosylase SLT domain-containing protein [Qipengyuania nanhaisediminis]|uniref:transglycosylase SLT domain-containing protein n=1 Tax=Qipengyuania nanhaisediminis TaxID=604088 RepID=UPI0038B3645A
MNHQSLPQAALRTVFAQAAQLHQGARGADSIARPAAARQIAPSEGATRVEAAIASAAQQTSVDFGFLVAQAQVESAMNPDARARTSSATGLYQFIESTWLGTMQRHGERFGLGDVAARIGTSPSGSAHVADPVARAEILALRSNPEIAALMAAGLAEDNRAHLAPILGRQPDHGELYLAHFLGAGGAGRFLSEMQADPDQSAAALFRRPAAANRAIFYSPSGRARSLAEVMGHLDTKLARAGAAAQPGMVPSRSHGAQTPRYEAASLAPPGTQRGTPPPYLIADEQVFAPRNPPEITGGSRAGNPAQRPSMSGLLESTFGAGASIAAPLAAPAVERAYARLKALGL